MKEITIIGAGIAGLELTKNLRRKDPNLKITLIDKSPYSFDKRELISYLGVKNLIELAPFAQSENIEFIQGSLERVSAKRKKIYFKEREALEFNSLVVATGLTSRKVPLRGEHREGFFYLSQINPFQLRDLLKVAKEATVYLSTILGLKVALALKSLGLEVRILSSNLDFLSEKSKALIDFLEKKGIPIHSNVSFEEAIGEGAVRAVKISPLKVFSSQLVFIDSGFLPNYDFFEEEIQLQDTFFTNFAGVYFLGDANRKDLESEFFYIFNQEEAKRQASIFADFILEAKEPIFERKVATEEDKQKVIEELMRI